MVKPGLFAALTGVVDNKKRRYTQPKQPEIPIELTYLFEGKPGTLGHRQRIISVVVPRVPVSLVKPKPVLVVVFVHRIFHIVLLFEGVVFGSVLFIHLFEAFFPEKMASRLMFITMTFVLL